MTLRTALALVLGALFGCQRGLDAPRGLAGLDEPFFRCRVQPILTKSCSTLACHGDPARYYKIFGRNRLRLGGSEDERGATMKEVERTFNLTSSKAQVDRDNPAESMLLLKPLDVAAGGVYHGGATRYGQGDVFLTRDDADYAVLEQWVLGAVEADSGCIEPGSTQ
jgi:hypothetical protein